LQPLYTALNSLRSHYADSKRDVTDGKVEFNQSIFDEYHQKMAAIQIEIEQLEEIGHQLWRREYDERNARNDYERAKRQEARAKVKSLDSQYQSTLKAMRKSK
jgi:hypothetical protein